MLTWLGAAVLVLWSAGPAFASEGTIRVLHSFSGRDGATAKGSLTLDKSGRNYQPADYCFCLAKPWGQGKVVVLSHSGIVGDQCTANPSWGQISAADNLTFLFNAVNYVAGVA